MDVRSAIGQAEALHGPLTDDHFRAFAILGEEVGEVAKALLENRRALAKGRSGTAERVNARLELAQVAATAVLMLINLKREGAE